MATTPQLNIRIDADLKEAFIQKAKENGTTATDLIVRFIQQYLGLESDRLAAAAVDSSAIQQQMAEIEKRLYEQLTQQLDERLASLGESRP